MQNATTMRSGCFTFVFSQPTVKRVEVKCLGPWQVKNTTAKSKTRHFWYHCRHETKACFREFATSDADFQSALSHPDEQPSFSLGRGYHIYIYFAYIYHISNKPRCFFLNVTSIFGACKVQVTEPCRSERPFDNFKDGQTMWGLTLLSLHQCSVENHLFLSGVWPICCLKNGKGTSMAGSRTIALVPRVHPCALFGATLICTSNMFLLFGVICLHWVPWAPLVEFPAWRLPFPLPLGKGWYLSARCPRGLGRHSLKWSNASWRSIEGVLGTFIGFGLGPKKGRGLCERPSWLENREREFTCASFLADEKITWCWDIFGNPFAVQRSFRWTLAKSKASHVITQMLVIVDSCIEGPNRTFIGFGFGFGPHKKAHFEGPDLGQAILFFIGRHGLCTVLKEHGRQTCFLKAGSDIVSSSLSFPFSTGQKT